MTQPAKSEMRWHRKDLLGIRELSAEEITFLLDAADAFKEVGTREIKKVPALRGKTLVNFFVEPSRTALVEIAAIRLSADVINLRTLPAAKANAQGHGDNSEANHADIIVIGLALRAPVLAERLTQALSTPATGAHHPTRLLDLSPSIEEETIAGLHVAHGDILFTAWRRTSSDAHLAA